MRKTSRLLGFAVLAAIIGLFITGCIGMGTVTIRTTNNIQSVRPGGTLRLTASGKGIVWAVSSTSDGSGAVAGGTTISGGLLTVAINETSVILYVIVTSSETGQSVSKPIRVTTVTGVSVTSGNQSVRRGKTLQLSAGVTGSNNPDNIVTWTVSSNSSGTGAVTPGTTVSGNGLLTVAANETLTTLYVFATSVVDPSKSGNTAVAVIIPVVTGVAVSHGNQAVTSGGTVQLYASVTGYNEPDNAVAWRVRSNAYGTGTVAPGTVINANGVLTVAPNETANALYVFAHAVDDPSKFGSAMVTVIVPVVSGVVVSPGGQSMNRGEALQFQATVTGTNNPSNAVTWRVSSNAAGTGAVTAGTSINANGVLTVAANENASILYIIATSVADPSKYGNAAVNVTIPAVAGNQNQQGQTQQSQNQQRPVQNQQGQNQQGQNQQGQNQQGQNQQGQNQQRPGQNQQGQNQQGQNQNQQGQNQQGQNQNQQGQTQQPVPTVTGVTISPTGQTVNRGGTFQFRASVAGTNNPSTAVTWRVSSNTAGTGAVTSGTSINANGVLTVGANETNTTLYVIATSAADTTKSGRATITVPAPVTTPPVTGVTISPANPTVAVGSPLDLSATVAGTASNKSVTWKVSSNAAGTGAVGNGTSINNNGKLSISANETAAILYVTATSVADPTKSATIAVTVIKKNN